MVVASVGDVPPGELLLVAYGDEPVVLASVRLDGPDIPEAERIPRDLLVTGTEVHTKIRCGDRPLGYSLFYGVWEFAYEKVVFFFKGGS